MKAMFERIETYRSSVVITTPATLNALRGGSPDLEDQPRSALAGIRFALAIAALAATLVQVPQAGAQPPELPDTRELVVGTKVAPPFAMKDVNGTWSGISFAAPVCRFHPAVL
jgi:hypothetical protein